MLHPHPGFGVCHFDSRAQGLRGSSRSRGPHGQGDAYCSWWTVLSPKMDARNLLTVQSCFGEVTLV